MKIPRLLLPALGAFCLLAAPASSLADHHHSITVYRDRDGDGHFNRKTYNFSNNRSYRGGHYYYGSGYGYPYGYGGYGYRPYGYGYYGGPALSFSYSRTYSPGYSSYADSPDGLAVDVQRELRRRGYYRGTIDGDIGLGTRNAIRAYQYDRGLSTSGRIDRSLLHSLGIG